MFCIGALRTGCESIATWCYDQMTPEAGIECQVRRHLPRGRWPPIERSRRPTYTLAKQPVRSGSKRMTIDFGWFLPTMGDTEIIGPPTREATADYRVQVARTAEHAGFVF